MQKLIFLISQIHSFAINGNGTLLEIQHQAIELKQIVGQLAPASAQHRLDPADHLHDAKGLHEVVVSGVKAVIISRTRGASSAPKVASLKGSSRTQPMSPFHL